MRFPPAPEALEGTEMDIEVEAEAEVEEVLGRYVGK